MTAFLFYLLKVMLCSGVLYLYYALALKNKLFHYWNRFYLLAAVVLSLALPLVQVAVFPPENDNDAIRLIKAVQAADDYLLNITVTAHNRSFDTAEWLLAGYATGSLLLLALFAVSLLRIKKLLQTHTVKKIERINFVATREPGTPFSFLRYIFWNEDIPLQSETGQWIFEHELVHVKEKHTADKLFLQMVLLFFWCNPFFWLMRRELSFVHEFIADKKAVGNRGASAFAAMILQTTFPQQYSSITNSFFQLSIKRRFAMLTKQNNPRLAYAVRIVALPLLALVVFAFTVRTKQEKGAQKFFANLPFIKTDTVPKRQIESVHVNKEKGLLSIYYVDGSCEILTKDEAKKRGLLEGENKVEKNTVAKITSSSIELKIKDSSKPLFVVDNVETTAEAVSKLEGSDAIESIRVLKGETATKLYGEKGNAGVVEITTKAYSSSALGPKPLYIVDGGEVDEKQQAAINPTTIQSISVLKGPLAIAKYGDKGKNGVIEITLKRKPTEPTAVVVTGKPLQRNLTPVVVEGKPLNKSGNATTQARAAANEEVVVAGRPLNQEPRFEQTETPASVDQQEWRSFLEKNTLPIVQNMTQRGAKKGRYVANVRFVVEKDGSLSDIQSVNAIGYGADDKIVDMMKSAPKWRPAEQNGKIVRSFHTQPITLVITN